MHDDADAAQRRPALQPARGLVREYTREALISSALPDPTNNAGSGALRRATSRATATSPADSASRASSSSEASKDRERPKSTPTRMARAGPSGRVEKVESAELKVQAARGKTLPQASRLLRGFSRLEVHGAPWYDR